MICEDKEFDPVLKAIIAIIDAERKPKAALKQEKGEKKTNTIKAELEKKAETKTKTMLPSKNEVLYIPRGQSKKPQIFEMKRRIPMYGERGLYDIQEVNNATRKRFPPKKHVSAEEAEAFFQKMNMPDYEVVDQLRKYPEQVSMLSLLMRSAEHQKILLKTLNEAYVPAETSVEQLERMAERFFAVNQVSFSKNDLPPEGAAHNKALHLTVKCEDYYIKRGFKPGKGLGKSLQGITEPITLPSTKKLFGIGFQTTPKDEDWEKKRKNDGRKLPRPLPHLYETFGRLNLHKRPFLGFFDWMSTNQNEPFSVFSEAPIQLHMWWNDLKDDSKEIVGRILGEEIAGYAGLNGKLRGQYLLSPRPLWMQEHLCHRVGYMNHRLTEQNCISGFEKRMTGVVFPKGVEAWLARLRTTTADQIEWAFGWLSDTEVIYMAAEECHILLMGVRSIQPYAPHRVLRQLGKFQWGWLAREEGYRAEIGKLKQQVERLKFENSVQVTSEQGEKNKLTKENQALKARIRQVSKSNKDRQQRRSDERLIAELRNQFSKSQEDLERYEACIARMRVRWAKGTMARRKHLQQVIRDSEISIGLLRETNSTLQERVFKQARNARADRRRCYDLMDRMEEQMERFQDRLADNAQIFDAVSTNKIPEGKSIPHPRIASATVMIVSEMLSNGFVPGKGLGAELQGIVQPVSLPKNLETFGLGFKPTAADIKRARKMKKKVWVLPKPVPRLSRSFVRAGVTRSSVPKIRRPLIGPDGDLDEGLERMFADVNTIEAGEGSKYDEDEAFEEINMELSQFEEKSKPNLNDTEAINLGDADDIRETIISIQIAPNIREELIKTLIKFNDVFAWSYDDMPGLRTDLVDVLVLEDSDLLVHQIQGEWETRDLKLIPYRQCLHDLSKRFRSVEFRHIPRIYNEVTDALDTLASMLHHPDKIHVDPLHIQVRDQHVYYNMIEEEVDGNPWFYDVKEYLRMGIYPEQATGDQKRAIRRLSNGFFLSGGVLYKRTPDLGLLRCLEIRNPPKGRRLQQKIHSIMQEAASSSGQNKKMQTGVQESKRPVSSPSVLKKKKHRNRRKPTRKQGIKNKWKIDGIL
ncbi:uncharacterized protein [Nicotiana sylvestris]|uniref:uncharacterized protein n=1 Tax=Nicotiana sylvestris TaxID=4096 RepID=UPI00388CD0AE